jgi:hypothetical protein
MDDFFPGSKRKRREPRPVPEKKRSERVIEVMKK